jgi:hypothetical protein
MRNRRFKYEKTFPCGCAGGRPECGVIGVVSYPEFGNVEIGISTRKDRYQGNTKNPHIYLDLMEVVNLRDYLDDVIDKYNVALKKAKVKK